MKKISILVLATFLTVGSVFAADSSTSTSSMQNHSSGYEAWTPSLGVTQTNLSQKDAQGLNQTAMVASIGYNRVLSNSNYGVGADFSSTLVSLDGNSNINSQVVYFINADLFASRNLISVDAWNMKLIGGGAYRTAMTANSGFGYSNVAELQVEPMISKSFSKGSEANVYGRYNPVIQNGLTAKNREIAVGTGYKFAANQNGNSMIMNAEWTTLNYDVNGGVKNQTMTLGLGYSM